jgi:hypothetical protein
MNERLKELDRQAFDEIWDSDKTQIGPSTRLVPVGFIEKFAELIVKECAKLASEETSLPYDSYSEKIKQHFGIE